MTKKGKEWSAEEEEKFKKPIVDKYEREGHPYFSSARLWDDGIIRPQDTRKVLGLALDICTQQGRKDTKFGIFRM